MPHKPISLRYDNVRHWIENEVNNVNFRPFTFKELKKAVNDQYIRADKQYLIDNFLVYQVEVNVYTRTRKNGSTYNQTVYRETYKGRFISKQRYLELTET